VICEDPYMNDGMAHGCGRCLPCRIKHAKTWTHRIILEATQHRTSAFITLTYDEEHNFKEVSPSHLRDWIKRIRHHYPFRYYAVGEYGERTLRPHYHLAAFGYPHCERGQTDLRKNFCCTVCQRTANTWGKGAIQVGRLEEAAAAYVAGYVTKKLKTKQLIPADYEKPFQRMSLKPGIGYNVMHDVADVMMRYGLDKTEIDVPTTLQIGKKKQPLGKYLRKSLRKMIGKDEKAPKEALEIAKNKLQPVRENAFINSASFKEEVLKTTKGRIESVKARHKIYNRERL